MAVYIYGLNLETVSENGNLIVFFTVLSLVPFLKLALMY